MADSEGESVGSNQTEEQILEDLLSKLKQFAEESKKLQEELDEEEDIEEMLSVMIRNEELMLEVAEWAKEITKPQFREAVIHAFVMQAFQRQREIPINYASEAIEMLIESLEDHVKEYRNAKTENYEEEEEEREFTLNELLDKLSEIAQQVLDLKD